MTDDVGPVWACPECWPEEVQLQARGDRIECPKCGLVTT